MKRILFKTCVLFVCIASCLVPRSFAKTCLWKVSSETNTVYLLGSVHVLREADYPLPEVMEQAFSDAERIVFEIHPDSAESPSAQMKMMRMGMLPQGVTLKSTLHDTVYVLLEATAKETRFNLELSQQMKPWMVGMMLMIGKMQESGISPEYGVDRFFFKKARESGKSVRGLETVDFQIAMFDSLTTGDPNEFLIYTLKEMGSLDSEIDKMIHSWREGDIETLSALFMKEFEDSPEIYDRLVVRRNQDWLRQILNFLQQDEDYLIVVGAAHLFGKDGIIPALEEKGYRVEQW